MGEAVTPRVGGMVERRDVLRLLATAGLTIGAGAGLERFIGSAFGAQAPGAAARKTREERRPTQKLPSIPFATSPRRR